MPYEEYTLNAAIQWFLFLGECGNICILNLIIYNNAFGLTFKTSSHKLTNSLNDKERGYMK